MENFPTLKRSRVPRIANGLTLLVMLAATWWSNDQRPLSNSSNAATAATLPSQAGAPRRHPVATPAPAAGPTLAVWPAQTTSLPADGIKPVGFATTALR